MEFPRNPIAFIDGLVDEHKRRLRARKPVGETLRYMGETLDQQGRGEEFLRLWVHNPKPQVADPNALGTDLALLQLYEHWRKTCGLRPIEPWDGTTLRPWLSRADNPRVPACLTGEMSHFSEAITRAPGAEIPWRRLDALGHALEAHLTQIRRHHVWARPARRPRGSPAPSSSSGGHAHAHEVAPLEAAMLHGGHDHGGGGHEPASAGDDQVANAGKLRLYFHNELNNIETAPYSIRFWGFLKWADNRRRSMVGLPVAHFPHDKLSDISFMDEFVVRHFAWHDDVFGLGACPTWDDQFGRYQTHRYAMNTQGYAMEFLQFHRDLVDAYEEWLARAGFPAVESWHTGRHHTSYVLKYAWDWWWGRGGTNGRPLDPAIVAPELLDPKLSAFDTCAELGHYLEKCGVEYHGVGHVQNCDIRDPYCNNYSIRFFGWHKWIDNLFTKLQEQGKPLFDDSKPLTHVLDCGKYKKIPDPPSFLDGHWTYRSFHNDPDGNADPRWFVADLELRQLPDGSVVGRLDSGDPQYVYNVVGRIDETNVKYELEPEWWDDRIIILLTAVGATPQTEGHRYDYVAHYQPTFPTGKEQLSVLAGSTLRARRPDDPTKEGKVGSFTAVKLAAPTSTVAELLGNGVRSQGNTTTQTFTQSGVFVVPDDVSSVSVKVWGAGGGGGSDGPGVGEDDGRGGGESSFGAFCGGAGAKGGEHGVYKFGKGGAGGGAHGGTTNVDGESGETGGTQAGETGKGGDGAGAGGKGGARLGMSSHGKPGDEPGGGGSGSQERNTPAGGGGGGGYAEGVFPVEPGARVKVTVGDGGAGGDGGYRVGGPGARGRVEVSWSVPNKSTASGAGRLGGGAPP